MTRKLFRAAAPALLVMAFLAGRQAFADTLEHWRQQRLPLDPAAQLQAVTRYVHLRVRFEPDTDDRWQTPLETLTEGRGDCEDFALAKFALLRAAGWPPSRLRLAYGHTFAFGAPRPHLVLLAYTDGDPDPFVLDNLGDEPRRLSSRPDLELLFSFSEQAYWRGASPQRWLPVAPLGKWNRVLARMTQDGTLPSAR